MAAIANAIIKSTLLNLAFQFNPPFLVEIVRRVTNSIQISVTGYFF